MISDEVVFGAVSNSLLCLEFRTTSCNQVQSSILRKHQPSFVFYTTLLEVKPLYEAGGVPSSVGWLVGWPLCHNFSKRAEGFTSMLLSEYLLRKVKKKRYFCGLSRLTSFL